MFYWEEKMFILQTDAEAFATGSTICCVLSIIIIIIVIILGILILKWIFGSKQTVVVQQPIQNQRHCPNCGHVIPFDANVCSFCGNDFRTK